MLVGGGVARVGIAVELGLAVAFVRAGLVLVVGEGELVAELGLAVEPVLELGLVDTLVVELGLVAEPGLGHVELELELAVELVVERVLELGLAAEVDGGLECAVPVTVPESVLVAESAAESACVVPVALVVAVAAGFGPEQRPAIAGVSAAGAEGQLRAAARPAARHCLA